MMSQSSVSLTDDYYASYRNIRLLLEQLLPSDKAQVIAKLRVEADRQNDLRDEIADITAENSFFRDEGAQRELRNKILAKDPQEGTLPNMLARFTQGFTGNRALRYRAKIDRKIQYLNAAELRAHDYWCFQKAEKEAEETILRRNRNAFAALSQEDQELCGLIAMVIIDYDGWKLPFHDMLEIKDRQARSHAMAEYLIQALEETAQTMHVDRLNKAHQHVLRMESQPDGAVVVHNRYVTGSGTRTVKEVEVDGYAMPIEELAEFIRNHGRKVDNPAPAMVR